MKNIESNTKPTNPFRVPEGYFDQLKLEIMAKVSAEATAIAEANATEGAKVVEMEPTTTRHRLLRPIIGVAASVCVAIFGVSVYMHNAGAGASVAEESAQTEMLFASDDASDYIMMDNEDIYRYLCGIE